MSHYVLQVELPTTDVNTGDISQILHVLNIDLGQMMTVKLWNLPILNDNSALPVEFLDVPTNLKSYPLDVNVNVNSIKQIRVHIV